MINISKETKIDLLESAKRAINSLSFENIQDIELSMQEYSVGDRENPQIDRMTLDILFYE